MDKMKRMRKSIIWMAAFMFCCGAVFAQKAERKNVREGNKFMRRKSLPRRKSPTGKVWK